MELFNIDIERKVLQCLFSDKDCIVKIINRYDFKADAFSDKSIRFIYRLILSFFSKNGKLLSVDILLANINRFSLKAKDSKLFKSKLESVVDNFLQKEIDKDILDNFDIYVNELFTLWQGRRIQDYHMELFDAIDAADIDKAVSIVQKFHVINDDEGVSKGEYSEDFDERERAVLSKYNNPDKFSLLSTGIESLDTALYGGVDSEFCIISGSSNMGKSTLISQISTNCYRLGKNVILFLIGEMDKMQIQNKIDCNVADIDYSFFRNPSKYYSKEVHDRWKQRVKECKEKSGLFEIVSFRKNATVSDILSKTYDIMNTWQKPLHGIFIDSIDNITPVRNKIKDWMAYEEICWDTFLITKSFKNLDNKIGIPVWATTQLKKSGKDISMPDSDKIRKLDERDVGSSPFQYRYSEIFIGIRTITEDIKSVLQIMKGRSVAKKSSGIDCYHNFPYGRFHDSEKKDEYIDGIPSILKEELEGEGEIVIEDGED